MNVADRVGRLAALVGLPERQRNGFDWPAIESSLGLRLPEDYKRLVDTLPDGFFQRLVQLNRPGDHHQPTNDFLGFYASQLEDMRELRTLGLSFPYPIFPEPGGLLPWAHARQAEPIFWITEAEDPNTWPVVATNAEFTEWREFPGTACEFLIELVEGRFDDSIFFRIDPAAPGPEFQAIDDTPSLPRPGRNMLRWERGPGPAANEFAALAAVVGPAPGDVREVDWAAVRAFTGFELPTDYRAFVDAYGPGTFGEIKITVPDGPGEFDMYDLLTRVVEHAHAPDVIRTAPIYPEPDGMIAWGEGVGIDSDRWTFGWAPTGSDPERWGVVVQSYGGLAHLPDASFSQFLRRYAEGDDIVAVFLGRNTPLVTPPRFTPYTRDDGKDTDST